MGQDPPAPFGPGATRRATVRVGVGVLVLVERRPRTTASEKSASAATESPQDDRYLVYAGRRKGSHGASKLALPGGHLELNETWEGCAAREVHEEMGLDLPPDAFSFVHATNDIMESEGKHYVTIFMVGYHVSAASDDHAVPLLEPENREPDKCEGWQAYSVDELLAFVGRDELFSPLEHLLVEQPTKVRQLFDPNAVRQQR